MIGIYIQFLILYLTAQVMSISTIYAYYHYSSVLDKGDSVKNVILLFILTVICVIFCILVPGEMIYIGFRLVDADKWEGGWGRFMIVISWLIPPAIISVKKNRETEKKDR